MRLRHIKGCEDFVNSSSSTITDPQSQKGNWRKPLHIEIGMGKGQFIRELSRRNPDIFYLGIERYESVIQKAIERKDRDEAENGIRDNLLFICMDAGDMRSVFDKGEVDRIYLNFSDPWPKARHAHRRLTSPDFMRLYEDILSEDGTVEFKTDNDELFEYSLVSIPSAGWEITYCTRDLHSENIPNIMTEYEEKFSAKGKKINKLTAKKKKAVDN